MQIRGQPIDSTANLQGYCMSNVSKAQDSLTILMPCLNEAATIGRRIETVKESLAVLAIGAHVMIADNGSSDGSQDIARAVGAEVIHVPQRGYGAALRAGISQARTAYVVMGDSDLSYDFSAESITRYLRALDNGADLVIGNRFKGKIYPGAMPWLHKLATPVMSMVVNIMFGTRLGDINCGLRGFRRQALESLGLRSDGMEFASEMIIRAAQEKLIIVEVPTNLFPDGRYKKPHLRSFRDGWRHLKMWLFLWKNGKKSL